MKNSKKIASNDVQPIFCTLTSNGEAKNCTCAGTTCDISTLMKTGTTSLIEQPTLIELHADGFNPSTSHYPISNINTIVVNASSNLNSLKHLDLSHNRITSIDFLKNIKMNNLKSFTMRHNNLTVAPIPTLNVQGDNATFDISCNNITNTTAISSYVRSQQPWASGPVALLMLCGNLGGFPAQWCMGLEASMKCHDGPCVAGRSDQTACDADLTE